MLELDKVFFYKNINKNHFCVSINAWREDTSTKISSSFYAISSFSQTLTSASMKLIRNQEKILYLL